MTIRKVLCVCLGNSDRSPAMAAILRMYLKNTIHQEVVCESAGIGESASEGTAAPFAIAAAHRIGLDLTEHRKRHIAAAKLDSHDLIICANDDIAATLIKAGVPMSKLYNAQIANPWPVQFQEDYDRTFEQILSTMYRVVARYFSEPAKREA